MSEREHVFDPTYDNDPSLPPLPRLPKIDLDLDLDLLYPRDPYDDSPVQMNDVSSNSNLDDLGFDVYEIDNTDTTPGSPAYGWRYFSDGTAISPDSKYYFQGELVYDAVNTGSGALARILGKEAAKKLRSLFVDDKGNPNLAGIATLGTTLYGLLNQDKQGGYSRPVPKLDMVRDQVQFDDPNRRPGEGGRQYFTDPRFVEQGNAEALAGAKAASAEQAAGIQAAYQPRPEEAPNPYAGKMNLAFSRPGGASPSTQSERFTPTPISMDAIGGGLGNNAPGENQNFSSLMDALRASQTTPQPRQYDAPEMMQQPVQPSGPVESYAQGGIADAGRYLQGKTDGMADEIPSSIDGEQPAALSHGEFVIPADVVSHLGNGNSDAGAQKLYEMMSRIRQARTGTKEQGKEIDADEFTMGGLANAYAGGGRVRGFSGVDGSAVTANPALTPGGIPHDVSRTSTLSPYVGEYVTDALARGSALAQAPYQAYQGPLTAGASDIQQQAFAGASDIAGAGFTPTQFSGGLFDTQAAQSYMNPYIQSALDPQLRELQRQSDIQRTQDAGRLTRAGAFGGGRQAIMESEGRRNLLDKQQDVLGQGYATAYDKAMAQFNADQGRSMDAQRATEASRQYGADFGLRSVNQLADMGATQRGITSEGLAADKAQFEEQRDFAYAMPKYQLSLLSGLPIAANTTSIDQDAMGKLDTAVSGFASRFKTIERMLEELGVKPG